MGRVSFAGAMQRWLGRFEIADPRTIFLDEVGEILPDTQVPYLQAPVQVLLEPFRITKITRLIGFPEFHLSRDYSSIAVDGQIPFFSGLYEMA
jgi:hypothetical protein